MPLRAALKRRPFSFFDRGSRCERANARIAAGSNIK
jgi:hypothetical protein